MVDEEGFGVFPYRFPFDGLIDDFLVDLHVELISEGVDLFVDEGHIKFGVLSGEVDVF